MGREFVVNKVYNMDCLVGLRTMPKECVDVIVTSPPYNIGIPYNTYNDKLPKDEYLKWIGNVAKGCKRVLKEEGSFFLNVGGTLKDPWIPFEIAKKFQEQRYFLQNTIHWVNSIAISKEDMGSKIRSHVDNDLSIGHYKPINSKRFHHDSHEYIFHFTHHGDVELDKLAEGVGVPYQYKCNINRWKSTKAQDMHDRGNVWFIPYQTINIKRDHPSVFPVQLPKMCIIDHGVKKVSLVLDPFMGVGTTALACIQLGVNFVGFEIDPHYEKISQACIEKEKKKLRS